MFKPKEKSVFDKYRDALKSEKDKDAVIKRAAQDKEMDTDVFNTLLEVAEFIRLHDLAYPPREEAEGSD